MIYLIVNPAAGSGKGKAAVPIIEAVLNGRGVAHSFIHTEKCGDLGRVERLIDYKSAEAIVCVGGDGTVQEYAGLAVGKGVKFGVVPAGSANDFLLSLQEKPPKFRSFEQKVIYYANKAAAGETVDIDAILVNNREYCINIGGTGIDIQVLKDALPMKRFIGGAAYFVSLVKNAATYKTGEMTLTVDGKKVRDRYLLLAVCNGAYYGGRMNVAPGAKADDGFITLCAVKRMPRLKLMALFPRVKPGKHVNFKEVSFTECKEVVVGFEGTKTFNLDGNLADFENSVRFGIIERAVRFIV